MEFLKFNDSYKKAVYELYCDFQKEDEFYKDYTYEDFSHVLFENHDFNYNCSFICVDGDKLVGFGGGLIRSVDKENPNASGYVHTLIVKKEYRNKKIGSKLLEQIEDYFKEKGLTSSRCVFLSSINYAWYIPNTDKHMHPGTPGVRINSPYYLFLYHHGYFVNSIHEGFHLNLSDYKYPTKLAKKMEENEKKGITVELYDPNKHFGVDEFCEIIGNSGFAHSIKYNLEQREKPLPFVIASDNGKMVAWTGAIYTEPTGRGHLDGVCVSPEYRKLGLGTGIFAKLCMESKKNNAKYMTLFTGLDNPARYIYMGAGFNVATSFADMKKNF